MLSSRGLSCGRGGLSDKKRPAGSCSLSWRPLSSSSSSCCPSPMARVHPALPLVAASALLALAAYRSGYRHAAMETTVPADRNIAAADLLPLGQHVAVFASASSSRQPPSSPPTSSSSSSGESSTRLYIVTPTYPRLTQIPDLTRLGQTLMHVKNMLWLVCDDTKAANPVVLDLLEHLGVPYEYYTSPMPDEFQRAKNKPRGVANRNRALRRILEIRREGHAFLPSGHSSGDEDAVFYFADDDNTYDLDLFEEIRKTRRVSVFPVGLVTTSQLSTPVVDRATGAVVDFYDGWMGGRTFPMDMAGFAVNVGYYVAQVEERAARERKDRKRDNDTFPKDDVALPPAPILMPFRVGYEEDGFLKQIVKKEQLEPLANNCTKILVWHTKTTKPTKFEGDKKKLAKYPESNLRTLEAYLQKAIYRPP